MPLKPSDAAHVRNLSLFRSANDQTFGWAIAGAFLQKFPAGTTLLMEGDSVDFLYILLEGSVELGAGWKSRDTTLAVLRPVSTFILAAVVLDADALMSAVTLERSEILMVPGESLRRAMKEDAEFCFAVSEELAGCYRGLVRSIKNQKLRDSTERLANYLLIQRAQQGGKTEIVLPHEKRVLASLLGMSPENLSRAFSKLQAQGVTVVGAQVRLDKTAALEKFARPSLLIDNHYSQPRNELGEAYTERQKGLLDREPGV
ncbi:MAG: cyclic nucleotide-binding domain-containing protein [Parvibaculum sp.]|uniref:cyclic nucleotide-binding domain-containing protein n=1 Tax=Parvibaculum sp. TaxID=2024848 RepID=UPI001E15BD3C|nr:cyclic nucleotide-binding domain-containing protein [Parvibaculum sp.]MBX3489924.1 cyclic nucleotide-binding domain-containing protein [Parvibaculum sp.]MBX3494967.1 cyclic nucleotide-binding domain-containing protein [Parvibaculum sp.]MCW5726088.1 cyclic nucleotide-binding domain-containing protein [Parvibaculum sp.]